jgi:hypothetical protein
MERVYPHEIETGEERYKFICCEVMFREACWALSQTRKVVDAVFLPKGLHDIGAEKMRNLIQEEIDKIDAERYDAILLGYGLCNNGVVGLSAGAPLVIPRAHDCITLFLGSKERYKEVFHSNPGTYYKTPGWIERENPRSMGDSVMAQLGADRTYEEYVEKYGKESADYLMEMLGGWVDNYSKLAYIDTSVTQDGGTRLSFGDTETYRRLCREKAEELGWEYEEMKGDIRLIEKLISGDWDPKEFLVVPPGRRIVAPNTNEIVALD